MKFYKSLLFAIVTISLCSCSQKVTEPEPKPQHVHSYVIDNHDETSHWKECECGDKKDVSNHNYGTPITIKDVTCTEDGKIQKTCSDCGYVIEEIVETKGHIWAYSEDEGGLTHSRKCSVCKLEEKTLPHSYNDWSTTSETHSHTCTLCHHEESGEHTVQQWKQISPASHKEKGVEVGYCSVCGKEITRYIEKIPHDWKVTKTTDATFETNQIIESDCECGETKVEEKEGSRLTKYYGFEDGDTTLIDLTNSQNVKGISVVSDVYSQGTHSLKIELNGSYITFGVAINLAFMKEAFNDSSVNAILFDAKANEHTKQFMYKVNDAGSVRYEQDLSEMGIDTNWKTYAFTRTMYESATKVNYFISSENVSKFSTIWIDNVRLGNANDQLSLDFESGSCTYDNNYAYTYYSSLVPTWKTRSFRASNCVNRDQCGYSYDIKLNGNRSYKVSFRYGQSDYVIGPQMYNNIPENGGLTFSVYSTKKLTGALVGSQSKDIDANWWVTFTVPKAEITSYQDMYEFFKLGNSAVAGDLYFDDIHVTNFVRESYYDFENTNILTSGTNKYAVSDLKLSAAWSTLSSHASVALETSVDGYGFEVSDEKFFTGSKALKLTLNTNYGGWYALKFNSEFVNALSSEGVEIHILATNGGVIHNLKDINDVEIGKADGKWQTVRITKETLITDCTIVSGNNSLAGSYYFDNIHSL